MSPSFDDILKTLDEVVELAEEGWAYAPEYFRKKYNADADLERVRKALDNFKEGRLRALKTADELTPETQTIEEAVADLVRQIREVRRQRDLLFNTVTAIAAWDCLNDPKSPTGCSDLCDDFPWLKKLVTDTLKP